MKRKFLEDLGLEKEQIDKIMSANGEDIETHKKATEDLKAELTQLKEVSTTYEKQLEELKKVTGNTEELKSKITELQEANKQSKEEYDKQIKALKVDNAISVALKGSNAKYEDLISAKFDREKITITDDGKVIGVDEQLKGIRKDYADLFKADIKGVEPDDVGKGGAEPQTDPFLAGLDL